MGRSNRSILILPIRLNHLVTFPEYESDNMRIIALHGMPSITSRFLATFLFLAVFCLASDSYGQLRQRWLCEAPVSNKLSVNWTSQPVEICVSETSKVIFNLITKTRPGPIKITNRETGVSSSQTSRFQSTLVAFTPVFTATWGFPMVTSGFEATESTGRHGSRGSYS